jgi:hypothetical protein
MAEWPFPSVSENSEPVNANDRFRLRREARKRQVRRRRMTALGVLAIAGAGVALAFTIPGGGSNHASAAPAAANTPLKPKPRTFRTLPAEIRGVHITMELAPKLDEYLRLPGLNTLEVDVKDENGEVAFSSKEVPLATAIGAARDYYDPQRLAQKVHRHGVYLIGRVVTFEDPILSEKRPQHAIRRADGGIWHNNAGLGWTNPYDRRVWKYDVDIGVAAAKAGFDEIQYDYVRFPSDGDISLIRYPGTHPQPMKWTIPAFVQYARKRIHPLKARLSVDVFGLAATRDLGIGQIPGRIARYVDAMYPMVYPSHFGPGEYDLVEPNDVPLTTVAYALRDFRKATARTKVRLVPWLQDFTLGRTYTLSDIRDQVQAARLEHSAGFMLWNAAGVYTRAGLTVSD